MKSEMKRTTFFLLFYLFTFLPSQSKVIKVLAIGNSFSEDATEQYLYELANAQGDSLVIGNAYIAGCSIERHYNNLKGDSALYGYRKITGKGKFKKNKITLKSIIRDEQWDIITFQQASHLSGIPDSYLYLPLLKRLVESYTTNLHIEFVWHMTWAYANDFVSRKFAAYDNNQRQMYSAIVNTMLNVLPGVGIHRIIPSGIAIQLMRYRMGDVLNRDGYHLTLTIGRYTAACTWCEFLTGKIVDGNPYFPDTITPEEAQLCQQEAHEAVFMQQQGRYLVF
jgi:hypothetical protein